MTTRLWTALLLLSAVFALHGLQCTADSTDPAAGHIVAIPAGHDDAAAMAVQAAPAALAAAGMAAVAEQPPEHPTAVAVVAAVTGTGHGSGPHDAAGHLWTVCLAVLAAGLAVLLAVTGPRLLRLAPPTAAPSWLRRRSRPALLRPPDLFSLCVLRT